MVGRQGRENAGILWIGFNSLYGGEVSFYNRSGFGQGYSIPKNDSIEDLSIIGTLAAFSTYDL